MVPEHKFLDTSVVFSFSFEMLLCTSWLNFSLTDAIVKRERCEIGTASELTEKARTQGLGAHFSFTIPAIFAAL